MMEFFYAFKSDSYKGRANSDFVDGSDRICRLVMNVYRECEIGGTLDEETLLYKANNVPPFLVVYFSFSD